MYLGQSVVQNIISTILIVGTLFYIGWVIKLMFEKDDEK